MKISFLLYYHLFFILIENDSIRATTHTDLVTRAKSLNVPTKTIHNASIMNAVGSTGLSLYAFGQTVSIPFHTDTWKPTSFMEKIKVNLNNEFHTLLLLDIKVKEQSIENMARGRLVYEPARFMKVCECIEQLLFCESVNNQNGISYLLYLIIFVYFFLISFDSIP